MSDSFSARVDSNQSNVYAGNGSQYIYQFFGGTYREQTVQPLAPDHLKWLKQRFEPPENLAHARQILRDTGTVLLHGQPGHGRNAAARMLLYEYRELRANLREVLPEDERGGTFLDPQQIDDGEGLLLDLSRTGDRQWPKIRDALSGYHAAVREHGCRLAVVLPHPLPTRLDGALGHYLAEVRRPDPVRVLRRAIQRDELPEDLPTPPPEPVQKFLREDPPMGDVAEFARLISVAHRAHPSGTITHWCAAALEPFTLRFDEVARRIVALGSGRARALLLSTAMLDGARSDAVYEACETLLGTVEYPRDERPLLEREDLSERFGEIKATPDPQGRVTLAPSYALAVRTHFWNNMPGLRSQLGRWVGETLALPTLSDQDRAALAERFAEQTLRTGRAEDLIGHVRAWTDGKGTSAWPAAGRALTHGTLDPEVGRRFRQELYEWATTQSPPRGRARVLLDVCGGDFAKRYPEQALVRLHHLARNQNQGQETEVQLRELATSTHHLHRLMIARLASGLKRYRYAADTRLFLTASTPEAITDTRGRPRPLLDERTVRQHLTEGWSALFACVPRQNLREHVDRWLSAADVSPPHRCAHFLDVLVASCRGQADTYGFLYHLARTHRVARSVLQKIDAAQGVTAG